MKLIAPTLVAVLAVFADADTKSVLQSASSHVLSTPMTLVHAIRELRTIEKPISQQGNNPLFNKNLRTPLRIDVIGADRLFGVNSDWMHLYNQIQQPLEITLFTAGQIPVSYCYADHSEVTINCQKGSYHMFPKHAAPHLAIYINANPYDTGMPATTTYLLDRKVPTIFTTVEDAWCGLPQESTVPPRDVHPEHNPFKWHEDPAENDFDNKCIVLRDMLTHLGANFVTSQKMMRNPFSTLHKEVPEYPPKEALKASTKPDKDFDGNNMFVALVKGRDPQRGAFNWLSATAFARAAYTRDIAQNLMEATYQDVQLTEHLMARADEVEAEMVTFPPRLTVEEVVDQLVKEFQTDVRHQASVDQAATQAAKWAHRRAQLSDEDVVLGEGAEEIVNPSETVVKMPSTEARESVRDEL